MDKLGAAGCIGGVCDLKYIKLPVIQDGYRNGTVTDCGDGMNPDMEKIIDLHPDAILLSPFENSGGYGRVEKLNIPIIECADYILVLSQKPTAFLPRWIVVITSLENVLHFRLRLCLLSVN